MRNNRPKRHKTKNGKFKLRMRVNGKLRYYKYTKSIKQSVERIEAIHLKKEETSIVEELTESENYVYALVYEKVGKRKLGSTSYAQLRIITSKPFKRPTPAHIERVMYNNMSRQASGLWDDFKEHFEEGLEVTENNGTTTEDKGIQLIIDYARSYSFDEFKRGNYND